MHFQMQIHSSPADQASLLWSDTGFLCLSDASAKREVKSMSSREKIQRFFNMTLTVNLKSYQKRVHDMFLLSTLLLSFSFPLTKVQQLCFRWSLGQYPQVHLCTLSTKLKFFGNNRPNHEMTYSHTNGIYTLLCIDFH